MRFVEKKLKGLQENLEVAKKKENDLEARNAALEKLKLHMQELTAFEYKEEEQLKKESAVLIMHLLKMIGSGALVLQSIEKAESEHSDDFYNTITAHIDSMHEDYDKILADCPKMLQLIRFLMKDNAHNNS